MQFEIISTEANKGICGNYNNGLRHAKGEWIKYIAGDDILVPECIETFVKETGMSDDRIMISGTLPFCDKGDLKPRLLPGKWFSGDAREQERLIVRKGTVIEGPTLFLHRETLITLGGFEEKYPFIEDYPLCMKYLKNGYRIRLVEKHLIRYREYPESVSRSDSRFSKSIFAAIDDYAIPAAKRNRQWLYWWHYRTQKAIRHREYPKPVLYLMSGLDPVNWKNKLVKN